ncbi:cupin domain-containing protein [Patescibacteria group bacterium]|nr:cupin domain-containing protein [Patescibacteria group bacterium]MBU1758154.1 cupin domain-containing protein [Patescibacteria group bacterium]
MQTVKIQPGEIAKPHIHKIQTEVFYFLTDNGYWIVNDERIQPKVGDILIIEPNDVHTVGNETKEDYVYLCFKVDYIDQSDFYNV